MHTSYVTIRNTSLVVRHSTHIIQDDVDIAHIYYNGWMLLHVEDASCLVLACFMLMSARTSFSPPIPGLLLITYLATPRIIIYADS
jgi:hypothetical protein